MPIDLSKILFRYPSRPQIEPGQLVAFLSQRVIGYRDHPIYWFTIWEVVVRLRNGRVVIGFAETSSRKDNGIMSALSTIWLECPDMDHLV